MIKNIIMPSSPIVKARQGQEKQDCPNQGEGDELWPDNLMPRPPSQALFSAPLQSLRAILTH
jgi:hypothetical protein